MQVQQEIDVGDMVVCDLCSADFTDSDEKGGFLFGSKGVCPRCAPAFRKSVESYNEQSFIKAEAADGETFKEFVLKIRDGNNIIRIMA